jgi:hypothetical protein
MPWEYKVIWSVDVIVEPSMWQTNTSKAQEYATGLENTLNHMSRDGWELVSSCSEPWIKGIYLFFRRAKIAGQEDSPPETGIMEM